MKFMLRISLVLLTSLLVGSCCLFGICEEEEINLPVNRYKPVVLEREIFENAIGAQSPQAIIKPGKIYIKDNLMFLNEINKGFHVFKYTNPETPIKLGFIKILGATDVAIRNETIYINQATDLVSLIYNETTNTITVLHRNKNVFPQKLSPDGNIGYITPNQIIIDWILN